MNKYTLIFLLVLMSTVMATAQSDRGGSYSLSQDLELVKLKSTFRLQSSLNFGITRSRHSFNSRIILNLKTNHPESTPSPKISGIGVGYSYSVPSSIHWLSFFGKSDLTYQFYDNIWTANYFSEDDGYVSVASSSLEHFLALNVGYGFRVHLWKGLYVTHGINGGKFISLLDSGRNITDGVLLNGDLEHDFRRYGDSGWLISAFISAGIRF
ncbi:MAG: hypothetical protein R3275_06860 [Saprospiraceae bacterium]|nr:hypothetical protein [Saprospiraceae bacterium]